MMNENGKAAIINAVCKDPSPPAKSRMTAMVDCAIPHVSFTAFAGSSDPLEVCMPSTNVAESAEVIKKVEMSNTATIDNNMPSGNSLNTANNVSSVNNPVKSTPLLCTSIAVVPNAANQMKLMNVGMSKTPNRNSRMVRPLETRAMKIPTNGDQEIHHAQ